MIRLESVLSPYTPFFISSLIPQRDRSAGLGMKQRANQAQGQKVCVNVPPTGELRTAWKSLGSWNA